MSDFNETCISSTVSKKYTDINFHEIQSTGRRVVLVIISVTSCSTSLNCVIGMFHWYNHSSDTMALELTLTQFLTEMSAKIIYWR
jgi:hypothetical protein